MKALKYLLIYLSYLSVIEQNILATNFKCSFSVIKKPPNQAQPVRSIIVRENMTLLYDNSVHSITIFLLLGITMPLQFSFFCIDLLIEASLCCAFYIFDIIIGNQNKSLSDAKDLRMLSNYVLPYVLHGIYSAFLQHKILESIKIISIPYKNIFQKQTKKQALEKEIKELIDRLPNRCDGLTQINIIINKADLDKNDFANLIKNFLKIKQSTKKMKSLIEKYIDILPFQMAECDLHFFSLTPTTEDVICSVINTQDHGKALVENEVYDYLKEKSNKSCDYIEKLMDILAYFIDHDSTKEDIKLYTATKYTFKRFIISSIILPISFTLFMLFFGMEDAFNTYDENYIGLGLYYLYETDSNIPFQQHCIDRFANFAQKYCPKLIHLILPLTSLRQAYLYKPDDKPDDKSDELILELARYNIMLELGRYNILYRVFNSTMIHSIIESALLERLMRRIAILPLPLYRERLQKLFIPNKDEAYTILQTSYKNGIRTILQIIHDLIIELHTSDTLDRKITAKLAEHFNARSTTNHQENYGFIINYIDTHYTSDSIDIVAILSILKKYGCTVKERFGDLKLYSEIICLNPPMQIDRNALEEDGIISHMSKDERPEFVCFMKDLHDTFQLFLPQFWLHLSEEKKYRAVALLWHSSNVIVEILKIIPGIKLFHWGGVGEASAQKLLNPNLFGVGKSPDSLVHAVKFRRNISYILGIARLLFCVKEFPQYFFSNNSGIYNCFHGCILIFEISKAAKIITECAFPRLKTKEISISYLDIRYNLFAEGITIFDLAKPSFKEPLRILVACIWMFCVTSVWLIERNNDTALNSLTWIKGCKLTKHCKSSFGWLFSNSSEGDSVAFFIITLCFISACLIILQMAIDAKINTMQNMAPLINIGLCVGFNFKTIGAINALSFGAYMFNFIPLINSIISGLSFIYIVNYNQSYFYLAAIGGATVFDALNTPQTDEFFDVSESDDALNTPQTDEL